MISWIFLLYAASHLGLFIWALFLFLRCRSAATVPLLIVTFGLIYDNAVLAAGSLLGHGDLLEQLSVPRFFMHAFATPLLMLTSLRLLQRSGAKLAQSVWLTAGLVILTVAMIALGVESDLLRLELEAKQTGDLISYGNAATSGPPLAPIVTVVVLISAGVIVWRRGIGPWLLLGALFQFAAAAAGDALVVAGNLGELALLAGLVVTNGRLCEPANSRVTGG